jgi:hypothetical protein
LTVGVLAITLACSVLPVTAGPVDVDIELVLAADASGRGLHDAEAGIARLWRFLDWAR